jgi:pyridoxal phosphate enzyme (YggS family)
MTERPEIGQRLDALRRRVAAACRRAGRESRDVVIVGASTMQPVESLQAAHDAGLVVFGENRVQEAARKAPQLPTTIDWHLIGPLQSNKARRAVELFSTLHSVDRPKIARVIDRVAGELGVRRRGLLEINIAGEQSKHGLAPEGLLESASAMVELQNLEIVGLMAIPPFGPDPESSRPWFRRLRALRDQLSELGALPGWQGWLSMGLSGEFEVAIEEGATHVRVGTSLFGPRPPRRA